MNNTQGASPVPLTVFGGAVTEMSPEDLPEGASPINQDMDFTPGSVTTRGGRQNQYTYAGLFSEKQTQTALSVPGTLPNETPWTSPNNATLNTPGVYASLLLNFGGGGGGFAALDKSTRASGINNTLGNIAWNFPSISPLLPNEWALIIEATQGGNVSGPTPGSWTSVVDTFYSQLATTAAIAPGFTVLNGSVWAAILALFFTNAVPVVVQNQTTDASAQTSVPLAFTNPIGAGNTVVAILAGRQAAGISSPAAITCSDSQLNAYSQIDSVYTVSTLPFGHNEQCTVFVAKGVAGTDTVTLANLGGVFDSANMFLLEVSGLVAPNSTTANSQYLQASNFGFSIPSTVTPLGFQVEISGHQTVADPTAVLSVSLINPTAQSPTLTTQLPLTDGTVFVGTTLQNWGLQLTPNLFNNPNFGVNIAASNADGNPVGFYIYSVKIKVWLTPNPTQNFNWVKTFQQTNGAIDTLALDAGGLLWQEDVINNPNVLTNIFTGILPGSFAKGETFDDVEYFGVSNLLNGTDVPRLWDGMNLRRVSQVGPGAPPQVAGVSAGSPIVNITQNPAVAIPTSSGGTSGSWIVWSAGPSADGSFGNPSTPGNVMTWVFPRSFILPAYITVGANIVIAGVQSMNGYNPNNGAGTNPAFYTVTSVGQPDPTQQYYDGFTITLPQNGFYNQRFTTAGTVSFQATIATVTTTTQVPFLEVGNSMQVEGNSQAGYNNTWVVAQTPNAAQLQITNTSLTGGVATFSYTLISGTTPVPGQFVTTTGTLNGGGIFNLVNASINTAGPNTFTVILGGPNVSGSAETGNGIINGTIFIFDPAGVVTNPIIGTGTGGLIATAGVIGIGVRRCVCLFQTDSALITAPSPYVQFNISGAASNIVVSQIPIGPPNVLRRILAFTAANGGNFYYIPVPVPVTVNGQLTTYSSTVISDNTTTQVTLSFPDTVLVTGLQIDIQGNNLFNQIELGSCLGFTSYSSRLIAIGEQNKIQNLLNLSFDGGIGVAGANLQNLGAPVLNYPLGWTVDPVNGGGGSLAVSPVFGNSYYVKNITGGTAALFGMLTQGAYQDQYLVPIINANTAYSVRITASCPSQIGSGSLTVDLYSPSLKQVYGTYSIPLASMASTMQIFTSTLLVNTLNQVPQDLVLRIYGQAIPNNGDFMIDRIEPFPTLLPVLSTQLRASYADNPQAFDLVTGGFGPNQNQQNLIGAFRLFDNLYALKTNSCFSTSDNGVTEPNEWNWREVSNKVGTVGINSYDYGEGWMLTACRPGVYFFDGGEPMKINQEFATLWDMINWQYGYTIWLRNDTTARRITIGIPIATGPGTPSFQYLPQMPANSNPTSPNVIITINYKELNTGRMLAEVGPIKSTYSGRIMNPEPARKSSFWNIRCPYADFVNRGNYRQPLYLCSGYGDSKIFSLVTPSDDDGTPINSFYMTYGFVKPEAADAKGLGLHRMALKYLTALVTGAGTLNTWVYPDSVQNDLPYVLDILPLATISYGDAELGGGDGITAQRFFLYFGTNALGAWFTLSKVVLDLAPDSWSPTRGTAQGVR
jgi:hypothetical protein